MTTTLDKTSAKILVLGDSGVGKSSLVYLLCHSAPPSSAQCTIGCSIDVKLHGNYFLEFWDIGGSRGHKIARSFLYQDYHGIVLVFDATNKKSRLNLNEWLVEVSTQKANERDLDTYVNINVPTITIGTRKDQLTYAALMEIERQESMENSNSAMYHTDENTSVVDFNNSAATPSSSYRRDQYSLNNFSSSYSASPSSTSSFQTTLSSTSLNEPLLRGGSSHSSNPSPVIYVNTQDAMSCSGGTKNYEKLNGFYKSVIERRNKRFYNKFAI